METTRPEKKRSLLRLITDVPTLVRDLVRGEVELFKSEMIRKLKALGIGIAILLVAAVILLYFIGALLTAAILALSLVMPGWLAALVIAFVLLVVAAILGLIGYRRLKKGIPPLPSKTIRGLKKDLNTVKGVGKRATTGAARDE